MSHTNIKVKFWLKKILSVFLLVTIFTQFFVWAPGVQAATTAEETRNSVTNFDRWMKEYWRTGKDVPYKAIGKPDCNYEDEGLFLVLLYSVVANDEKLEITCSWDKGAGANEHTYYTVIYDEDNLFGAIEDDTTNYADRNFCRFIPYSNDLYACYYGKNNKDVTFQVVLNRSLPQTLPQLAMLIPGVGEVATGIRAAGTTARAAVASKNAAQILAAKNAFMASVKSAGVDVVKKNILAQGVKNISDDGKNDVGILEKLLGDNKDLFSSFMSTLYVAQTDYPPLGLEGGDLNTLRQQYYQGSSLAGAHYTDDWHKWRNDVAIPFYTVLPKIKNYKSSATKDADAITIQSNRSKLKDVMLTFWDQTKTYENDETGIKDENGTSGDLSPDDLYCWYPIDEVDQEDNARRAFTCKKMLANMNAMLAVYDSYYNYYDNCSDDNSQLKMNACELAPAQLDAAIASFEDMVAKEQIATEDSNTDPVDSAAGKCKESAPGITELVGNIWVGMGCSLAHGLVAIKKFVIDDWMFPDGGEGDKFSDVLILSDPTTGEGNLVVEVWKLIRNIINVMVLLGVLLMALASATGMSRSRAFESFQIQRYIPSIVAAVLLVNFSLAIVNFFIIAANAFTDYFIGEAGLRGLFDDTGIAGFDSLVDFTPGVAIFKGIVLVVFSLILLYLYILLWLRVVIISILTMFAALPYLSKILPFPIIEEKVSRYWISQFTNWLLMGPLAGLLVYVAGQAIKVFGQTTTLALPGDVAGESSTIINLVIVSVLLYLAATKPLELGGSIMKAASDRLLGGVKQAGALAGTASRRGLKSVAVKGTENENRGILGSVSRGAGKLASGGLMVAALPKIVSAGMAERERFNDQQLAQRWGNSSLLKRFNAPFERQQTIEGARKLAGNTNKSLREQAYLTGPDVWQERAQAVLALQQRATGKTGGTPEEQQAAQRLLREMGYGGNLRELSVASIIQDAKGASPAWGQKVASIKGGDRERLRVASSNDVERINVRDFKGTDLDSIMSEYVEASTVHSARANEIQNDIVAQVQNRYGTAVTTADFRNSIAEAVRVNDGEAAGSIIRRTVPVATDTEIQQIISGMTTDSEYAAQTNAVSNGYSIINRVDMITREQERTRAQNQIKIEGRPRESVVSSLQSDVQELEAAFESSPEAAVAKYKEIRRPIGVFGDVGVAHTESALRGMQETLKMYESMRPAETLSPMSQAGSAQQTTETPSLGAAAARATTSTDAIVPKQSTTTNVENITNVTNEVPRSNIRNIFAGRAQAEQEAYERLNKEKQTENPEEDELSRKRREKAEKQKELEKQSKTNNDTKEDSIS